MMAKKPLIPKGPFGNYRSPSDSTEDGWVGDRSRGTQIGKFEAGEDYLFFQGPAPKSAVQPDLPGLLTGVRLALTPLPSTRLHTRRMQSLGPGLLFAPKMH